MTFLTHLPWTKKPVRSETPDQHPVVSLHREINRMFDSFFNDFRDPSAEDFRSWSGFTPAIDVSETENRFEVSAELPGMTAEDISLKVHNGMLTLSGEHKREEEKEDKNYYRMERSYGSFQRAIPLPDNIDEDSVDAQFKNGVLTVSFNRIALPEYQARRIEVKSS
ncbi:MAG: Hsp20/alpha crystallin family protein [Acidobacteria bacterium]|nr:Hsp20/alpha crystallin family protein [Acidobacteriota bacterium]